MGLIPIRSRLQMTTHTMGISLPLYFQNRPDNDGSGIAGAPLGFLIPFKGSMERPRHSSRAIKQKKPGDDHEQLQ